MPNGKNNFKQKKILKFLLKLFVLSYFTFLSFQACCYIINNLKKEKELDSLKRNLNSKVYDNEKLKQQIETGFTDELIQQKARDELNMVGPYERVFLEVATDD